MNPHVETHRTNLEHLVDKVAEKDKPLDMFNEELSQKVVKMTDKLGVKEVELALQVKQAREFMDWSANHMKKDWLEWQKDSDQAVKDARMTRMALERESKLILAACQDLRSFFGGDVANKEMEKMKEFVEVCERLQALKSNGFLDAIADTILKF